MGQQFAMSVPLVEPKGNFGSLDDPPAAYRYTEARLTAAAMTMVADIDENTVDLVPNFDGERLEPSCLPALLPNLLVNGASGIAVGMATNMAPHNLGEVVAAIKLVLRRPKRKPDITALMEMMPGPDFPTGGVIVCDEQLAEAYEHGRGSVRIRASVHFERITATRQAIVVTELPYMGGPRACARQGARHDEVGPTGSSQRCHRFVGPHQRDAPADRMQAPCQPTSGASRTVAKDAAGGIVRSQPRGLGRRGAPRHWVFGSCASST